MIINMRVLLVIACVGMFQLGWSEGNDFLKNPAQYAQIINQDEHQLIDVRTSAEFSAGTIGNAQNIDYLSAGFAQEISILDKNRPVYIFCRSGARSAKAREIMLDAGFTEVYDLSGGYSAWESWENMTKATE